MKILKNKFFLTLLFFLIIFILNNTNVFAFSYPSIDNVDIDIDYKYKWFLIQSVSLSNGVYNISLHLFASNDASMNGAMFEYDKSGYSYNIYPNIETGELNYWKFNSTSDSSSWGSPVSNKVLTSSTNYFTIYSAAYPLNIREGNIDIYNKSDGTLFFQKTLVPEIPEIVGTTIPALETAEQIPTAMVETLKVIIPVGLVIFGILLLILLVKSVILRMT